MGPRPSRRSRLSRRGPAAALAVLLACAGPAASPSPAYAEDGAGLAASLVELRSEVERLTDALEDARRTRRSQAQGFAARKAQLEAELQREELRVRQLREARERKRAEIEAAKADDAALLPVVEAGAAALRAHIDRALPFRREQRRAAVDQIEEKVAEGLLTPRAALSRLWALVEDELRMTRDTGLYRETLPIDGEPMMVDVVRFGAVGLYLRTGDGRVGTVAKVAGEWRTTLLDGEDETARINALFDGFKKQIRVGFYTLPNILPAPEERR